MSDECIEKEPTLGNDFNDKQELQSIDPQGGIDNACRILETTPDRMALRFMDLDQEYSEQDDWGAAQLQPVVSQLEGIDISRLSENQQEDVHLILHMYHHHQISVAMFRDHDRRLAQSEYQQSIQHLTPDNPNRVTKCLGFIANDDVQGAREWIQIYEEDIAKGEVKEELVDLAKSEIDTMKHLLGKYERREIYFDDTDDKSETQYLDRESENMVGNQELASYTSDELRAGASLPDKISSISHDIENGTEDKMEVVLRQLTQVGDTVANNTANKFVILGSMGLYLSLNEVRQDNERFTLVDQRISGGKNDYDIGVHPEDLSITMSDFNWDEQTQALQRGKVGQNNQMVDLMGRRELEHFSWREVQIGDKLYHVQTPEEMIFEKMNGLVNPGLNDEGTLREREIKWGIDIKLLKTYLGEKNGWTEDQVEQHLADSWNYYTEDNRYQGVYDLLKEVKAGRSIQVVLEETVRLRTGKSESIDVKEELIKQFGTENEKDIDELLSTESSSIFELKLKILIARKSGKQLSYEEVTKIASEEYAKLTTHSNS